MKAADTRTNNSRAQAWHTLAADEAAESLDVVAERGLTHEEAGQRLRRNGANRLPDAPRRSPASLYLAQFKSILIQILLGAALLSVLIGNQRDAIVIFLVVLINAAVSFYQEYRAEQSLAALREMLPHFTRIRRGGASFNINAEDVVAGDVVLLEAGDRIPADGRLVLAVGVETDESTLTGESQPVAKTADAVLEPETVLAERCNMLFMNTLLTRGRAEMLVTATGACTETGRLSEMLAAVEQTATPLQQQLDQLGRRLGAVAVTLVSLLAFLEWLRGTDLVHIVLTSIALAVAAIPEGLPVVVTMTLALGMYKMAHHRAILKRLASVETLGCTTVICSDKTGTLTLNEMTVRKCYFRDHRCTVTGEGYSAHGSIEMDVPEGPAPDPAPLLRALAACNDSAVVDNRAVGDPMEAALLVLAAKGGISREQVHRELPRIAEIPFDSSRRYMATFHRRDDEVQVFVKGAPDTLLELCSGRLAGEGIQTMDAAAKQRIEDQHHAFAGQGLRGLMIAGRTLPLEGFDAAGDLHGYVCGLEFIGLVGLLDPPHPETRPALAACRQAGIAVKMITGDHKSTASAIARDIGMQGRTLTGRELDRLDEDQLAAIIDDIDVFARVTPLHKVKIIRALQAHDHVVAMTGDGVNDAPALKTADIGIAMGRNGTSVAREAATMVLTDDNFATLVHAVQQGRSLYSNIVKFMRFQLSTTIGAVLTVFFAPLAGLPEPFTPIQILWINIIMDGPPALSLAFDEARSEIMRQPPRDRREAVLTFNRLAHILFFGIIMMVGTIAALYLALNTGAPERALTMAFTVFVLFQFFNVFNARNEHGTAFNRYFFRNRVLWLSLTAVLVLQFIVVHWTPAQSVFATVALSPADWLMAAGVAASILLLEEGRKLFTRTGRP